MSIEHVFFSMPGVEGGLSVAVVEDGVCGAGAFG